MSFIFNNQGIYKVPEVHPYILLVNHQPIPKLTALASNGCYSDLELVKMGEGFRSCMYKDTMGIPTICYGYNLSRSQARTDITNVGGNYDAVMQGGCLTESQCTTLLNKDLSSARSGAQSVFGTLSCACAQAVAVDMTYNLGTAGIKSFTTFDSMMKQGHYNDAAADGKTTLWCRQVGTRCTRDMNQLTLC